MDLNASESHAVSARKRVDGWFSKGSSNVLVLRITVSTAGQSAGYRLGRGTPSAGEEPSRPMTRELLIEVEQ